MHEQKVNSNHNGTAGKRNARRRRWLRRGGAVFSIEMLMFLSILIPLMFALTEFSLLWSARHTLEAATYEAARAAAMPCPTDETRRACAEQAADAVLGDPDFIEQRVFRVFNVGNEPGDFVTVEIHLPMEAAAPDLLEIIGITIEGKYLVARTVTRRE